ncbi:hypothetical protein OUZ56_010480 [Daphnia magna]|uniref:Uncharacterized protein n=1 Tax=Daphnia magna TaxID=35525 RepID=A0ABR0AIP6_9CRUS|nr:hypothetical protein OUZ56_010480 [Daphnia magna]
MSPDMSNHQSKTQAIKEVSNNVGVISVMDTSTSSTGGTSVAVVMQTSVLFTGETSLGHFFHLFAHKSAHLIKSFTFFSLRTRLVAPPCLLPWNSLKRLLSFPFGFPRFFGTREIQRSFHGCGETTGHLLSGSAPRLVSIAPD